MPKRKHSSVAPTEDLVQLRFLCTTPEQEAYELIRPVVLFGHSPAQRAKETGISRRLIRRKVQRFSTFGMASLFEVSPVEVLPRRTFPEEIRQAILTLKAEHPAFHPNELATICYARFGRRPSFHTIEKILAEGPFPSSPPRRFPPYAEIADPIQRRLAILHLHTEGWNIQSI